MATRLAERRKAALVLGMVVLSAGMSVWLRDYELWIVVLLSAAFVVALGFHLLRKHDPDEVVIKSRPLMLTCVSMMALGTAMQLWVGPRGPVAWFSVVAGSACVTFFSYHLVRERSLRH